MARPPEPPFLLFEDHGAADRPYRGRLYAGAERILRARRFDEVGPLLDELDAARRAGFHVAGFLAYEAAGAFESRLARVLREPGPGEPPLAFFGIFRSVRHLDRTARDALAPLGREGPQEVELRPACSREVFTRAVEAAREAIAAGEIYQLNLTFAVRLDGIGEPFAFYDRLCAMQPVAHAAYLDLGDRQILSLSPELFVAAEGERMVTRPMKGTAARHRDPRADRAAARALAADAKNRAENLMIVDLLRNDLSRLAVPGSVAVERLFAVEPYASVWQMTSTISARTPGPVMLKDLFGALFPCGSVTGAPKIRAMEWIARLERHRRGVYTGAIGWAEPLSGEGGRPPRLSFNVAIRTAVADGGGGAVLPVGAGIVWDSRAGAEYDECLLKARFALEAAAAPLALIETMRFEPGRGFPLARRHICRLLASARALGFLARRDEIEAALADWETTQGGHADAPMRVRLRLWRDGRIAVESGPLDKRAEPLRVLPVAGGRDPRDPFCRHKVSDRAVLDEARARARRAGADEVLFVGRGGELREGSYTSVFIRMPDSDLLLTPPLSAGILPGVLRAELLATGRARVARLGLADLARARDVFMGNALRGLMRAEVIGADCHNIAANS